MGFKKESSIKILCGLELMMTAYSIILYMNINKVCSSKSSLNITFSDPIKILFFLKLLFLDAPPCVQ